VGIKDAVTPAVEAVEPGDKMKVEVVSTGVAADELGGDGYGRGEEDDGGADEVG
jgi:hypothetical protein